MTFDLPGKSAAIGGYKNTGKLLPIGTPDPRVPPHALAQAHGHRGEQQDGWVEGLKSLVVGKGEGGKVLPAAAKLIKEEALLRRTAQRIEKVRGRGGFDGCCCCFVGGGGWWRLVAVGGGWWRLVA
eukprot:758901-Rhodomonas_salina.1